MLRVLSSFANANVLLVLGELMGENDEDEMNRAAIPLIAGAIVLAQLTMAAATWAGDRFMHLGIGRKPLFMAGLVTLPIRCALIVLWKDAGPSFLLSTQILDGLGIPLISANKDFEEQLFKVFLNFE